MPEPDVAKIRALNDHARHSFTGCRVVITPGIQALEDINAVLRKVQLFDDFTPANDPYHEHDFGAFHCDHAQVFWQISYYDLDYSMHSPDPSDPAVTARVLTVMLAEEY